MASLLGLPREIRNIIYEDCLVSRGIIEPCLLWCNRDGGVWLFSRGPDKLDIALLRVSKSVRSETEKIFYGQNTFHLEYAFADTDLFPNQPNNLKHFWAPHLHLFRQISIDLRPYDLPLQERRSHGIDDVPDTSHSTSFSTMMKSIHDKPSCLSLSWEWKTMILRQMRLKVLVVDVEYFYCTNGSCRMLENSWVGDHDPCMVTQHHRHPETLIDGVPCQNHPSQNMCVLPKLEDLIIKVTGTRSEKEAAHLHNMGFGCKECPLVGQKLDVEGCKRDKNKPSWGSPGWSR